MRTVSPRRGVVRFRRKLYNDDARSWVAVIPSLVIALLVTLPMDFADRREAVVVYVLLIFWTAFCLVYLGLTVAVFKDLGSRPFHRAVAQPKRARRNVVSRVLSMGGTLSLGLQGSVVALIAVLVVSVRPPAEQSEGLKVLAVCCVAASWLLVMVSQALAYARLGAEARSGDADVDRPLTFSGTPDTAFFDYLTLAATVSSSLAPHGVEVSGAPARSVLRTHTVLAFIFNSVVLAMLIAMVAAGG